MRQVAQNALPRTNRFDGLAQAWSTGGALGGELCALAVASLVTACLFWTAGEESLPALPWAATFLLLVVHQDVRRMRIPNWLTLPSLAAALTGAAVTHGAPGLADGLAGAGAALALLLVPFACRWIGAGDVKASLVLGALWGAPVFAGALWWMVVVGGLLAVALVAAQPGGLADLVRRWWHSLLLSVLTRRPRYFGPAPGSAAAAGLPFGVAMALGACAYQVWGSPWL